MTDAKTITAENEPKYVALLAAAQHFIAHNETSGMTELEAAVEAFTPDPNSLIRQRLQEILERHQETEVKGEQRVCFSCQFFVEGPPEGIPEFKYRRFPCDAYTAAHIGLAALDG